MGAGASCKHAGALAKMSGADRRALRAAPNPAHLAAQLTNAQPDGIANVTVSIRWHFSGRGHRPGRWLAREVHPRQGQLHRQGHGDVDVRPPDQRRPVVLRQRGTGHGGPKPGTVSGSGRASGDSDPGQPPRSVADRPAGARHRHRGHAQARLAGAHQAPQRRKVLLQGRKAVGGAWVTLDRAKVKAGAYSLHWTPTWCVHLLRVSLQGARALRREQQCGAHGAHLRLRDDPHSHAAFR